MEEGELVVARLLPVLLGPGDLRLLVAVEQLLAIRHRWRPDGIANGLKAGRQRDEPEHGWPESVGETVDEHLFDTGAVDDASRRRVGYGAEDKEDVQQVHVAFAIPENDLETAEEAGTELGVALVELVLDRSRRGEGHGFAAEPRRQDERADDGQGVEGSHPELGAGVTLRKTVSRGKVGDPFVQACEYEIGEAEADLHLQLEVGDVGDKLTAGYENNWDGEESHQKEDLEEGVDSKDESRQSGEEAHSLDDISVQTELELDSSLKRTESPTRALLQVTGQSVGNSSILKSLVAESSLPARAKEKRGGESIFSQGTGGPSSNVVEGLAADCVSRSGTPGYTVGILSRLHDVNESIERLAERVVFGNIVEELWVISRGYGNMDGVHT